MAAVIEIDRLREIAELFMNLRRDGELPKDQALLLLGLVREEIVELAGGRKLRVLEAIERLVNLIEKLARARMLLNSDKNRF